MKICLLHGRVSLLTLSLKHARVCCAVRYVARGLRTSALRIAALTRYPIYPARAVHPMRRGTGPTIHRDPTRARPRRERRAGRDGHETQTAHRIPGKARRTAAQDTRKARRTRGEDLGRGRAPGCGEGRGVGTARGGETRDRDARTGPAPCSCMLIALPCTTLATTFLLAEHHPTPPGP